MLLAAVMRRFFRFGRLILVDAAGKRHQICSCGGPEVVIRVTDKGTQRKLLRANALVWGEAYMDGRLVLDRGSLADLIEIHARSEQQSDDGSPGAGTRILDSLLAASRHYIPARRARRNAAHHYDLAEDLYALFLDSDLQYSCAYFRTGAEDLETAQLDKKRHIAAKLEIRPGMQVLDIGSGWGGMALYLARRFDCRVTGITLSQRQLELSRRRAREQGLAARVDFELCDYRSMHGSYDRIVSIGMLEHVGPLHYRAYFGKLRDLLRADGVALVHSIARMHGPRPADPWLHKYIFPGGYLPALSQLTSAVESSDLWLTDLENLRLHYAQTLDHWHRRFSANRAKIRELYDERFCRMWELYLLGCEAVFRYYPVSVVQLQISREIASLPVTRDYQYRKERELAAIDGGAQAQTGDKGGTAKPAAIDL
ncbi:MAG: cyclopropane-fatty-acyl-phospholipid synthase family protein [Gammaproteobacteria bacterium]